MIAENSPVLVSKCLSNEVLEAGWSIVWMLSLARCYGVLFCTNGALRHFAYEAMLLEISLLSEEMDWIRVAC